jgi:hypothetical protein
MDDYDDECYTTDEEANEEDVDLEDVPLSSIKDLSRFSRLDFLKNAKARSIMEELFYETFKESMYRDIFSIFMEYWEDSQDIAIMDKLDDEYIAQRFAEEFYEVVKYHVKPIYDPSIFMKKPSLAAGFIHDLRISK